MKVRFLPRSQFKDDLTTEKTMIRDILKKHLQSLILLITNTLRFIDELGLSNDPDFKELYRQLRKSVNYAYNK